MSDRPGKNSVVKEITIRAIIDHGDAWWCGGFEEDFVYVIPKHRFKGGMPKFQEKIGIRKLSQGKCEIVFRGKSLESSRHPFSVQRVL